MTEKHLITSRDNQKLRNARRVRDGKINGAVFVEGVRHAEEVLRSNTIIIECFYDEKLAKNERAEKLIGKIADVSEDINIVENRIFASITETNTPQGIVLIVQKPETTEENFARRINQTSRRHSLIVFLSEINNPSNLGAILRTAEAAGVAGIIVSVNSADVFSPKATRAALGANLRLPIWDNARFESVLNWASERKAISTAADVNASKKYTEIDWAHPRLLIFGSEAHGLSEEARANVEELIYIPMENGVESLNLAVSCGIILFEAQRQMQI
jgi:TrmH family RNA methyltransferase